MAQVSEEHNPRKSHPLAVMPQRASKRKRQSKSEDEPESEGSRTKETSASSEKKGPPLRRGDACLRCRAKKLKCSAEKPSCDQCSKRNDTCVYDTARPATRVQKLEAKLAQMEDQETRPSIEEQRPSSSSFGSSISHGLLTPYGNSIGQDDGLMFFNERGFADFSNGMVPSPNPQALYDQQSIGGSQDVPFMASSSPAFVSSKPSIDISNSLPIFHEWSWPSSGLGLNHWNNQVEGNSSLRGEPRLIQAPFTMIGMSQDVSNTWSPTQETKPLSALDETAIPISLSGHHMLDHNTTGRGMDDLNPFMASSDLSTNTPGPVDGDRHRGKPYIQNEQPTSSLQGLDDLSYPSPFLQMGDGPMQQRSWRLREDDVSPSAREYLLDLFFSPEPPRYQFGSEAFTETQFRAKLTLQPSLQPHPSLLFSMYTLAASTSYIPAIRSLADELSEIAMKRIEEAIRNKDRLIDAINACKIVSKWFCAKGKAFEAYQYSAKAVSLCLACGLHRIPSSVFQPYQSNSSPSEGGILSAPKDQWELCERIHAFWGVWGNEKGQEICTSWAGLLKDELIITPLPRPPEHLFNGVMHGVEDITLRDLYDLPHRTNPPRFEPLYALLLAGVHLFTRASNLTSNLPESNPSYRSLSLASSASVRQRFPRAYEEIALTCTYLEESVRQKWPLEDGPEGQDGKGWFIEDVPVMFLLLKCSKIRLLFPPQDHGNQKEFISLVMESGDLVMKWIHRTDFGNVFGSVPSGRKDNKSTYRNKNGLSGPYRFMQWRFVVEQMKECAGLLRENGRVLEAQACSEKAEAIQKGVEKLPSSF
ncbi:hypothetical protein C349_02439 [Cryptococcus neoformans var. grubii Br795]|uniref:Zn(2)-C6 fungal-type domain-containing protein n=1 Tax=Cryptococcus neoformans Tu259-1 TaxID=1230072 RepID=A0A854QH48_CRYNE|nr:hypothetical protein C353_02418 [Cryptococcus neoformans var. grubii AD1-83a]OXG24026.1 hypothetical protein C361_02575 [Cryptococcus neoformans var. grubii Tu259-1]OXG36351.1 hypothetical protein C360_02967 [Cryptococcus neoformans var. grubii Bt15]OXG43353.1 hypothetical protein C359_01754 [Cryptococcus neoformans var. grubii Bt120]OXG63015.1 hypothetical protein C354_02355 [Cryptococcus neoformans var. grubii MW-RSA1955]OXG66303.1 hypothetical protein C351_02012 [Cryptococcus neoformans 